MTTPVSVPPAGWYPNPSGSGGQSYWDGQEWGEPPKPPTESHKFRNGAMIAAGVFVALVIVGSLLPKQDADKPTVSESSTVAPSTTRRRLSRCRLRRLRWQRRRQQLLPLR